MTKANKKSLAEVDTVFKRARKIEKSALIKIEVHKPVYVTINGVFVSRVMKKKPAVFAKVTDLSTGEVGEILVNRVLQTLIENAFPNETYVGKSLEIVKGEKVKGAENEYYEFEVYEIEA